ncbi:hypothetical protein [Halopiger djelfimassiliensis]|nr:hypothetical protein [Halopiger djelfimassiliensis]
MGSPLQIAVGLVAPFTLILTATTSFRGEFDYRTGSKPPDGRPRVG